MSLRSEVENYDDDNLECRYPNHAWKLGRAFRSGAGRNGLIIVKMDCKCTAVRTDTLKANGDRVSSTIKYPEGYVLKGHGRIDRAVFRRERINRLLG